MRLTKALGLSVLAVVVAMAFLGTASAQADKEIALCFTEEVLCNSGHWPEKLMDSLTEEVLFLGPVNVICEHSRIHGETVKAMGTALLFAILEMAFDNCRKTCGNVEVDSEFADGKFTVFAKDVYLFVLNFKIKMSECPLGTKCAYSGEEVVMSAANTGEGSILVNAEKEKLTKTEGTIAVCGLATEWDACYELENPMLNFYLSLYELI